MISRKKSPPQFVLTENAPPIPTIRLPKSLPTEMSLTNRNPTDARMEVETSVTRKHSIVLLESSLSRSIKISEKRDYHPYRYSLHPVYRPLPTSEASQLTPRSAVILNGHWITMAFQRHEWIHLIQLWWISDERLQTTDLQQLLK
ncbi:hypothetical protein AVEN_155219-1 [Araneus ventricosus]|uniref:Uncharacterized protein n=1 Tax=Araneus ventricosus TaxID=182803 RepID=A0A4Y2EMM3_ARAVE|nr:hypothetical protein AVEN_155219-1 [Araneus ventricosus]